MLRLTKSGKRKYVSLEVSVKEEDWDFSKNTPKRKCPDRDLILSIIEKRTAAYRTQINEYRMENKDYTLETLVQRTENPVRNMTLYYIHTPYHGPAVLTENFFMDSHPDCAFLLSEEGQQAIVSLHVTGITAYLSNL